MPAKPSVRILIAVVVALVGVACSQLPGSTGDSPDSDGGALTLYNELKTAYAADDLALATVKAQELINSFPNYGRIDEVHFIAGEIDFGAGRYANAAVHYDTLATRFPASPHRQRALLNAAECYRRLEMPARSADALARLSLMPIGPALREESSARIRELVRNELSPAQVEQLVTKYPASDIGKEYSLHHARQAYARGDYELTYTLLADYLYHYPETSETTEARRLLKLASERRNAPKSPPSGVVDPNKIGVILPVTGELSLYGRLFEQGVEMAVRSYNAEAGRAVKIAKADTRGTPVGAVKAVRKLVLEEGALGIIGSVFTLSTISASIEANAWGTPLLSPVVSSDDLEEIGAWVFQTKLPREVEVAAMADATIATLGLERVAVIGQSRGARRGLADLFASEITRLGGVVVAEVYYDEGATDFREQLEIIRESAPEAIFIPARIEELLQIVPQVKFYDLQVQLLGLSNWNSEKLIRLYRDELEGALFPLETYHGKEPAAYEQFKSKMEAEGVAEVSPIATAGYFGTRLMLDALASGVVSREELRDYFAGRLRADPEQRAAEVKGLSLLTVHNGQVREFRP